MQPTPPPDTTWGLLLIAAIIVWATSPAKWQTFKKMGIAFVATFAMVVVLGYPLSRAGYGNGGFYGEASVLCGVIAALVMGRQHVKSLKTKPTAPNPTGQQPPSF